MVPNVLWHFWGFLHCRCFSFNVTIGVNEQGAKEHLLILWNFFFFFAIGVVIRFLLEYNVPVLEYIVLGLVHVAYVADLIGFSFFHLIMEIPIERHETEIVQN